ncbi:c-type cytochrome [Cohaesibacter gelatinilyticus]|uniref:Cytochrome c n=1 Tax=Cohaesibacter gelatinilyticus TaxID=372072 RepID=A0A285PLJ5_9HYPH|nr:c-type cytochrome [Cohaesibacter gelatinilyticus]SNZ20976.1 cytochrome c [Cohaesibacter gelatinilyticus]
MVSGLRLFLMVSIGIFLGFGQPAFAVELGDKEKGRKLFKKCRACHQIGKGAKNRVGPHLNMLFGRRAASIEGFKYSKGIKRAAAGGLEWHADNLSAYIENPKNLVSGTRMNFRGMKDPQDREDLLAYLRTFSDNPADIPEADPTTSDAGHDLDPAILALKGDPEYGEYLSGECTACHQTSGQDDGVPSIVSWPEDDFVMAMHAYKKKVRKHPVMQMIAGRLSDDEIASLAAFFRDVEN